MKVYQKTTLAVLASCVAGALGYASISGAAETTPSKGRIPPEAHQSDGSIDLDMVPDFVLALTRDGSPAGYVRKHDILSRGQTHHPQLPAAAAVLVVDETLRRVVGHMVPGRGFVPVGSRVEDVPPFEIRSSGNGDRAP